MKASADSGTVVYLSDGSAWEVRAENRPKVAAWPKGSLIGVYLTDDPYFAYRLILKPGASSGDIVSAKRLRRVH